MTDKPDTAVIEASPSNSRISRRDQTVAGSDATVAATGAAAAMPNSTRGASLGCLSKMATSLPTASAFAADYAAAAKLGGDSSASSCGHSKALHLADIAQQRHIAHYALRVGEHSLPLNDLLGRELSLRFTGKIYCVACGRDIRKSFQQGYCFPCVRKLACCDLCMVSPERCHYDQGTCREPDWARQWCMDTHYVYLSNTSAIKVGITQHQNLPSRWIDQGAVQALPIFKVASRHISGLLESAIAKSIADKTNWRAILKADSEELDLRARGTALSAVIGDKIEQVRNHFGVDAVQQLVTAPLLRLQYPVQQYPVRIVSLNFDKTPHIKSTLRAIKAQYLIFDCGVINIRKFAGYQVEVTIDG